MEKNKIDFSKISLFTMYLNDIEKYPLLTNEQLLEEYKNINNQKEIIILEDGKLNVDKLFNYISDKEDYVAVANYVKLHCINNYPYTLEDSKLIYKLNNFDGKYGNKKIDIKKQLQMYLKYKNSKELIDLIL